MKLFIPLVLNRDDEIVGFFTIYSNHGPIIAIFSSLPRLELVASGAKSFLEPGQHVAAASIDAVSVEDVAARIIAEDPTVSDHRFISDTEPMFEELFEQFIEAI